MINNTEETKVQESPQTNAEPAPLLDRDSNLQMMLDVPLTFSAELGSCTQTVEEVLQLSRGKVVELNKIAGEPLDILCNGQCIAQGEAVVVNERFGVRIVDIASRSERISRMGN